jgi:hypothetical protein
MGWRNIAIRLIDGVGCEKVCSASVRSEDKLKEFSAILKF